MTDNQIRDRLSRYGFYHVIPVTSNVCTPGNAAFLPLQKPVLEALERLDLRGKRVLDVGCRDGLFSFRAETLGAAEVIGIDNNISHGAVEFLIPFFNSSVKMHEMNLYDLTPGHFGKFDVVIFAGVLYHLRYPFHAIRVLRDVIQPGGALLIETAIFYGYDDHAMLYCPIGKESPYDPTSCTFFNKKGLSDTLVSLGFRDISASCLNLVGDKKARRSGPPLLDRATFLCRYTGRTGNGLVDRYWHATHNVQSGPGSEEAKREIMLWENGDCL